MLKKLYNKKLLSIFVIIILLAVVLISVKLLLKNDIPSLLSSLGYDVEVKDVTFRGYNSQKISASKDSEKILLQIVKDVERDSSSEVFKELKSPIESAQRKLIILDPYTGKERELSVPEKLKPVKEEIIIKGESVIYYLVYVNEIFSLKIFSETEVRYKGLFSTYYCPKKKAVYRLEIYYDLEKFNKEKAVDVLSLLFCR